MQVFAEVLCNGLENAVLLSMTLTPEELQTLDAAHPGPGR
jgi:hypothetical protein